MEFPTKKTLNTRGEKECTNHQLLIKIYFPGLVDSEKAF